MRDTGHRPRVDFAAIPKATSTLTGRMTTMQQRWTTALLALVVGATLAFPAAAQWKWRDSSGRVQYSDTPPPPNVPDKDILQRPNATTPARSGIAPTAAATPASGASAPAGEPELEAKRKKAEQDAAEKKKADDAKMAAVRAENCARAKEQMRSLDSGMRIARTNEKGEREFLDDKARAQEAQRTRDALASECSATPAARP